MIRVATRLSTAICLLRFFAICLLLSLAAAMPESASAQYTLLHGFTGPTNHDGANPYYGKLTTDGTSLYGLTLSGGSNNVGTIFKINPDGTDYQVLHSFNGIYILNMNGDPNDGAHPYGSLLLIGSTLYGMTQDGGTNSFFGESQGAIFKINTDGTGFSLIHSFNDLEGPDDGYAPYGSLVTDGTNLFGMTPESISGAGVLFSISPSGSNYTIMHTFGTNALDGSAPQGSLLYSGGVLYGMTVDGGTNVNNDAGTIFSINTDGTGYQVIYSFSGTTTDGGNPYGSLVMSNSTFYGMTRNGGANSQGTVFSVGTNGLNFQLLHSFSLSEIYGPFGDLTLSNSTLYGMAYHGGTNDAGQGGVFQIGTDGTGYQLVHVFSYQPIINTKDGSTPFGSLLLFNSQLYGMTFSGGSTNFLGAVFSLGGGGGGAGSVGSLKVTILPAAAVTAGAQWQVDGGNVEDSGRTIANLSVGQHTVTFSTVSGYATPAPQNVMITANTTSSITGTYTVVKVTKPTITITIPTSKSDVSNVLFQADGTAAGVGLAGVRYQLNGGNWFLAETADNWAIWAAPGLILTPGTNTFSAYAVDTNGNLSVTDKVSFIYIKTARLTVNVIGSGSFTPDLNGELLVVGKSYSMIAKAGTGFACEGWTGSSTTNGTKITFDMAPGDEFTLTFKDVTRPTLAILSPTKNQVVSNAAPVASGRAKDNVGVTAVNFRVNGGAWMPAILSDGTNWTTTNLSSFLVSGTNTISAFAKDAAGNASLTNTILFKYVIPPTMDWAPDSLSGLLGSFASVTNPPETDGFDASTFSETGAPDDTNFLDYGVGTYIYDKTATNMAQVSFALTNVPGTSNGVGPISLIFTNQNIGYFTNGITGDTGGFDLSVTPNLLPATFSGKTITATSDKNGKVTTIKLAVSTLSQTQVISGTNSTSSGTYTFTRYSPVCGVLAIDLTIGAEKGKGYSQATFTSTTNGMYVFFGFDSLGDLKSADMGTFTLK